MMMTVENLNYSKSLNELLRDICSVDTSINVTGVAIDSRSVQVGDLFLAYRGSTVNGVDYIDAAIHSGAVAVAIDSDVMLDIKPSSVTLVRVPGLRQRAGDIISRFYDEPSKAMQLIGVTGTNGKSTVSYMIAYALYALGKQSAVLGTLGYGPFKQIAKGSTTTPDPVTLHSLLSEWRNKIDSVVMEVSSHALDQGRVAGTAFDIAVFTNLSRDHLDYHLTLDDYAAAKFQLFQLQGLKHAIVNINDPYGLKLIDKIPAKINIVAYSIQANSAMLNDKNIALVYCKNIETEGLQTKIKIESPWGQFAIQTSMLGSFNIDNILAAFSTLCVAGFSADKVAETLSGFSGIPGRMEYFTAAGKPLVIVDYAHTPDALEKALLALRPYCRGELYCVFGCGGDRDVGKRPQMGAIAEKLADHIVLTNDNPRTETAEGIIENILEGIQDKSRVTIKYDRSDAITNTFLNAHENDVVLIAGKGHENTQQIGTSLLPFSDRELARRLTEQQS
jgi:UDP-N-acetylmuramoyl-L-alanyl-D-glutamate--2,6-diaminopimelate ligase